MNDFQNDSKSLKLFLSILLIIDSVSFLRYKPSSSFNLPECSSKKLLISGVKNYSKFFENSSFKSPYESIYSWNIWRASCFLLSIWILRLFSSVKLSKDLSPSLKMIFACSKTQLRCSRSMLDQVSWIQGNELLLIALTHFTNKEAS